MRSRPALLGVVVLLVLGGGCGLGGDDAEETQDELRQIVTSAVAAADLPVTRPVAGGGSMSPCSMIPHPFDEYRLTWRAVADDPPEPLEQWSEPLAEHLLDEGWTETDAGALGERVTSREFARDGWTAHIDVVRGTQGTGVDMLVVSPCLDIPVTADSSE